jgi:hypothetical protein
VLLALFLGISGGKGSAPLVGTGSEPTPLMPDSSGTIPLECGIVIEDVFNVDFESSSVEMIFWLWVRDQTEPYPLEGFLDIKGVTSLRQGPMYTDTLYRDGQMYFLTQAEFHVKVLNPLEDYRFPLNDQRIELQIELLRDFAAEVDVKVDERDFVIRPQFVQEWEIRDGDVEVVEADAGSTFGNFDENANRYKAIRVRYQLVRDTFPLFIKSFAVVFISFFLALFSFFMPNSKSEEKISLIVGGLFTAIGNMYIVSANQSGQARLTLVDQVHILTFAFLVFFAAMAVIEQRWNWRNNLKFDVFMFVGSIVLYALILLRLCMM